MPGSSSSMGIPDGSVTRSSVGPAAARTPHQIGPAAHLRCTYQMSPLRGPSSFRSRQKRPNQRSGHSCYGTADCPLPSSGCDRRARSRRSDWQAGSTGRLGERRFSPAVPTKAPRRCLLASAPVTGAPRPPGPGCGGTVEEPLALAAPAPLPDAGRGPPQLCRLGDLADLVVGAAVDDVL
jgi:hypothetical protein